MDGAGHLNMAEQKKNHPTLLEMKFYKPLIKKTLE